MSVFRKFGPAARALLSRPRKALTAAAATVAFVGISAVAAFATPFTIDYENDTLSNLLYSTYGGSKTAKVTLSATADTEDFDNFGSLRQSSVTDWSNWTVTATGDNGLLIRALDSTNDNGIGTITVDSNGDVTGWNFSFSNSGGQTFSSQAGLDRVLDSASMGWFESSTPGTLTLDPPPVAPTMHNPEPSTLTLFGVGLLGLAWFGRKGFDSPLEPDKDAARVRIDERAKKGRRRKNESNLDA